MKFRRPQLALDSNSAASHPRAIGSTRMGAAAVEFAVVAPMLFLLVLSMVEFGRMIMIQQILTNCAREGARKAVLPGATDASVQSAIDSYLSSTGIKSQTRTITPSTNSAVGGTTIKVTVSVPYESNSWLPVGTLKFLKGATISSSIQMRKEDF